MDLELYYITGNVAYLYPQKTPLEVYRKKKGVHAMIALEEYVEKLRETLCQPQQNSIIQRKLENELIEAQGELKKRYTRLSNLKRKAKEELSKQNSGVFSGTGMKLGGRCRGVWKRGVLRSMMT